MRESRRIVRYGLRGLAGVSFKVETRSGSKSRVLRDLLVEEVEDLPLRRDVVGLEVRGPADERSGLAGCAAGVGPLSDEEVGVGDVAHLRGDRGDVVEVD